MRYSNPGRVDRRGGRLLVLVAVMGGIVILSAVERTRGQLAPMVTLPLPLNANAAGDSGSDFSPQLTTDGAGTWIAVWESGDDFGGTVGNDSDILFARSTDNGVTWTAPLPLNTNAAGDSGSDLSPQLTTDGADTWIAVWESGDDLGGTVGNDRDILFARSTDNGVTWTAPLPLNTNAASDSGFDLSPQLTTDNAGNWLAVWESGDDLGGTIGFDRDILFARSTDNGVTWTAPLPLNTNAVSDTGFDFSPQLTTDGDHIGFALPLINNVAGTWLAVWDSDDDLGGTIGNDRDILIARSTDDGITWTAPLPLNANAAGDSGFDANPQLTTDNAGNWLAVWDSDDDLGGTIGNDCDILIARSTDNGVTWTAPMPLNTNAAGDSGFDANPQLTTDNTGNWLAVWFIDPCGECEADIFFARSIDGGVSWTDPLPLNTNAATDSGNDSSPQLTTDNAGNWLAVWQSDDDLGGTIGFDLDILFARLTFSSNDCNNNGIADDIDLAMMTSPDCNANGIPDSCDISECTTDPACDDCNNNGVPDVCDISTGSSADVDANGVPDECDVWDNGGGDNNWSTAANWVDNSAPGVGDKVVIDGALAAQAIVNLDIPVTIDLLRLRNDATLTVTGGVDEDLTIMTDGGLVMAGLEVGVPQASLLVANDRSIHVALGSVILNASALYRAAPGSTNVSASLSASSIQIREGFPPGEMVLTDAMSVTTTGDFLLRYRPEGHNLLPAPCSVAGVTQRGGAIDRPRLRAFDSSSLSVGGDLIISGGAEITIGAGVSFFVAGSIINEATTCPEEFDMNNATVTMGGTSFRAQTAGTQRFEAAGENRGPIDRGFDNNFAVGTLIVASGADVSFMDSFDNKANGMTEALYVDNLIFRSGSTITVDNSKVYYRTLTDNATSVTILGVGQLTAIPPPAPPLPPPLPPAPAPGNADGDGDGVPNIDDDCPDTSPEAEIDDRGCSCSQLDDDGDRVDNCTDQCGDTPDSETANDVGCSCSQLNCDDGVDCTDDTCEGGVCRHVPNDANCPSDGQFCNGIESCDLLLGCVSEGDSCPAGTLCNEEADVCGQCLADEECDDGDACTEDSCEDGTCANKPLECPNDAMFCNGTEGCVDGECTSSGTPCLENQVCNEDNDTCDAEEPAVGQPLPQNAMCGASGDGCTPTGPTLMITFLGLFALRFVGLKRRVR